MQNDEKQPGYDGLATDDLAKYMLFAAQLDESMRATLRRVERQIAEDQRRFEEQVRSAVEQAQEEASRGLRE